MLCALPSQKRPAAIGRDVSGARSSYYSPMIKRLLHTRYRVTDLEKTVSFYKDVLGLEETRRHTSGRGSQLVFFKAPGSEEEIELCKFDESGPVIVGPDLTHLAFEVDDIEEFAKHSRRRVIRSPTARTRTAAAARSRSSTRRKVTRSS
jgi:lactoylglutathione lyase